MATEAHNRNEKCFCCSKSPVVKKKKKTLSKHSIPIVTIQGEKGWCLLKRGNTLFSFLSQTPELLSKISAVHMDLICKR